MECGVGVGGVITIIAKTHFISDLDGNGYTSDITNQQSKCYERRGFNIYQRDKQFKVTFPAGFFSH